MNILVTGAAGFIGASLSQRLLARGETVVGVDNLNDYYDVELKQARLARLTSCEKFSFTKLDIKDRDTVKKLFADNDFDIVVNLAAQAGIHYSVENPAAYIDANVVGFGNILEGCRSVKPAHLVYASSSSVYGSNRTLPFSESHAVDHPVSVYAATKKANELLAHTYAHLFGVPCTGLRFFTVYGPWGRPDMALFKFTKLILNNQPIDVYNNGQMTRDFTYIDDIVTGVVNVIDNPAHPDTTWSAHAPQAATSYAPYRVYNIGNSQPVQLMRYIELIEQALGRTAKKNMLPMQPEDLVDTYADVSRLQNDVQYKPDTPVEEGVNKFVDWYRSYYGV